MPLITSIATSTRIIAPDPRALWLEVCKLTEYLLGVNLIPLPQELFTPLVERIMTEGTAPCAWFRLVEIITEQSPDSFGS